MSNDVGDKNSRTEEENEESMKKQFESAESIVRSLEDGRIGAKTGKVSINKAREILESLTRDVSALSLFSDNESIDELPPSSLPFLLLPAYLGFLHGNGCSDIQQRLDELRKAEIYYKDFLQRLKDYGVIDFELWWSVEDDEREEDSKVCPKNSNIEQSREKKIERFKLQKELEAKLKSLSVVCSQGVNNDADTRDLYMTQLKFWANKVYDELCSVEAEIPLVKRMLRGPEANENDDEKKQQPRKPLKTFTITRDQQQKKVFGLGYPSIPTLTVDEWYSQRFENAGSHGTVPGPSNAPQSHDHKDDDCSSKDGSDDDDSEAEEEKRRGRIHMDEYKDTHRRGWGNTHNKG
ncbi:unnamed protein product [Auanema sp. JU1783]|nr:unnamed protein product [Auanema sp. JU1783]